MKEGPDIARIAALIGDPGRANMLTALMAGRALTATELAAEAGIAAQTASSHLAKLAEAGLIAGSKAGRHKYFTLTDAAVAEALEALMGLAARQGHLRHTPGPSDPGLRQARQCYNHLAGDLGVQMLDSLRARGLLIGDQDALVPSVAGSAFFTAFGVDLAALAHSRRPLCRTCLDWSARRAHLAGALGQAMLDAICAKGWAARATGSRAVHFTPEGHAGFARSFAL
jgi:DNA-binding transcriptional ArsR family regulator